MTTTSNQHHPTPTPTNPPRGPTLLITRSPALTATVTALAEPGPAPLVITPDHLPDTPWARYPLILIDADTAPETIERVGDRLNPRAPLMVCATPNPTPDRWGAAVALGAQYVICLPEGADWLRDRLHTAAARDPLRVITVLDVCGDPHGPALAAALGVASAQTGRDTQLVVPRQDPSVIPELHHALTPSPARGELTVLTRNPDRLQVSADELTVVITTALPGETVILDATPLDTDTARAAIALADLTLLVAGPWATQLAALGAAADTLAHLAPHAHRLGLVLSAQRPCHTPADALATQITTAAAHLGWTKPLPVHTWQTTTTPQPPPTPRDLHDLARTLLRDHHLATTVPDPRP